VQFQNHFYNLSKPLPSKNLENKNKYDIGFTKNNLELESKGEAVNIPAVS
jgi:hypothetical protein